MDAQATAPFSRIPSGDAALAGIDPCIGPETTDRYHFLKCLEQSLLGETWELTNANGERRLAHVLPSGQDGEQALEFMLSLAHDSLPTLHGFHRGQRPVVVIGTKVHTLRERFRECWAKGLPGIPKRELIRYIEAAASTLDHLHRTQHFQHLDVRPECLLGDVGQTYIFGFGLMHYLWMSVREQVGVPNPRYAAPELIHGQPHISSRCDQYSLALVYAEMLTGVHPFRSVRDRRHAAAPDLSLLGSGERKVLTQALATSPSQRFACLADFVEALKDADREPLAKPAAALDSVVEIYARGAMGSHSAVNSLDYFISELLLSIGSSSCNQYNRIRYKLEPGRLLEHHCAVKLFPGAALLKLEGFRQQWSARQLHEGDGLLVFSVSLPPSFWQRLTRKRVGIEIQIQIVPNCLAAAERSEVVVLIRPFGCSSKEAVTLLNKLGPQVLESLRGYLQAQPEQRVSERLPFNETVRVMPVLSGIEIAEPIECITKDVSSTGIGFFLSRMLPSSQVYINLPKVPELARFAGLAEVVRSQPCGEGWFEVGARSAAQEVIDAIMRLRNADAPRRPSWREVALVAVGLALLIVLQLAVANANYLFRSHFWLDELFTFAIVSEPDLSHALRGLMNAVDTNPPTLHLLLRLWTGVFGQGEIAFRSFALLTMYLAMLGIYLGLRDMFSPLPALAGMLAVWCHPLILRHAFETRFYGPWLAGVTWYGYILARSLRSPLHVRWLIALAAVSVFVCTIHYFGVFTLGLITVFELWAYRPWRWPYGAVLSAVGMGPLALIACAPFFLGQRAALTVGTWIEPPTAFGAILGMLPLLLIVCLFYLRPLITRNLPADKNPGAVLGLLSLALLTPVLTLFSLLIQPATMARYILPSLAALAPLAAFFAHRLPQIGKLGLCILLIGAGTVGLRDLANHYRERDQRTAALITAIRALPDATPVAFEYTNSLYVIEHYAPDLKQQVVFLDFERSQVPQASKHRIITRDVARQVERFRDQSKHVDWRTFQTLPERLVVPGEEIGEAVTDADQRFPGYKLQRRQAGLYELQPR